MAVTKDPRGRKKMSAKDRKVLVYIMVPGRHRAKAQKEINIVADKYCS